MGNHLPKKEETLGIILQNRKIVYNGSPYE